MGYIDVLDARMIHEVTRLPLISAFIEFHMIIFAQVNSELHRVDIRMLQERSSLDLASGVHHINDVNAVCVDACCPKYELHVPRFHCAPPILRVTASRINALGKPAPHHIRLCDTTHCIAARVVYFGFPQPSLIPNDVRSSMENHDIASYLSMSFCFNNRLQTRCNNRILPVVIVLKNNIEHDVVACSVNTTC